MKTPVNVLIVEDSEDDAQFVVAELRRSGYAPVFERVETALALTAALQRQAWDVVIADCRMPDFSGQAALKLVRAAGHDLPFIIVSGTVGEDMAVEMLKAGANDYLLKDRIARLGSAVAHELEHHRLRVAARQTAADLHATHEQLRHLLRHSPAVIYSLKVEGEQMIPQLVSENITRLLGFTAAEACSFDWWASHLHPEDRERVFASLPETLAREALSIEYRVQHKDGRHLWVEDSRRTVRDATGRPVEISGVWADITGRKQLELKLRESERRFSDMMGNVQLISLMLDRNARIIYANDYLLTLTCWTVEEVRGRDYFEVFIPPGMDELRTVFSDLLADAPTAWHHENEILTRSGDRRLIQWNNSVLRSVNGEVVGTASIGEDITERKRAEAELRRTSDLLRAVASGTDDAVFVKDLEGRYLLVNEAAARFVGRPAAEIIGLDDRALFDGEGARQVMANDRAVRGSGQAQTGEERLTAAGATRTYLATKAPYRDAHGNIIGTIGISRDITDRKQAEATLRETEARLRIVTDNARVGLVVVSPERRYLFANAAYAEIYDLPVADLVGRKVADVLAPVYEDQIRPRLDRGLAGEQVTYELHRPTPAGERHYEVNYEPTAANGTVANVVVVVMDITERKRTEQKMRTQLDELLRWQQVMVNREERVQQLKTEVNELLVKQGEPPRYAHPSPP